MVENEVQSYPQVVLPPCQVGVATLVWYGDYLLMCLRKGSHGAGTWGLPGGSIDGDWPAAGAQRELYEETGLILSVQSTNKFTHELFPIAGKRFVTLYFEAWLPTSEPRPKVKVMEPDKCERWVWFHKKQLPQPLFPPVINMLRAKLFPDLQQV